VARSQFSHWYCDRKWRRKRADQLAKEPLCRFCKQQGRVTEATIADHVIPHRGDRQLFWFGALMSLCATCHSSTKQRMEAGQVAIGEDGWPMDVERGKA
jgi:5-methylcytosine-specific restriction endonuclease McrA